MVALPTPASNKDSKSEKNAKLSLKVQSWTSWSYTCASVTKQYNLLPAKTGGNHRSHIAPTSGIHINGIYTYGLMATEREIGTSLTLQLEYGQFTLLSEDSRWCRKYPNRLAEAHLFVADVLDGIADDADSHVHKIARRHFKHGLSEFLAIFVNLL